MTFNDLNIGDVFKWVNGHILWEKCGEDLINYHNIKHKSPKAWSIGDMFKHEVMIITSSIPIIE